MRKYLISFAVLLGLALPARAETLDIANFTGPAGWGRDASRQGLVSFSIVRQDRSFGQISVFTSVASTGDAVKDFEAAWAFLVTNTTGVAKPANQTQGKTSQGFPMVVGAVQATERNIAMVKVVGTVTANRRVVMVLAQTNAQDLLPVMDTFVQGLTISSGQAPPAAQPAAPISGLDGWSFEAPPGYKTSRSNGAIILSDGVCTVGLLPFRPAGQSIDTDVQAVFSEAFLNGQGWSVFNNTGGPYAKVAKGISPDGWEYMQVRSYLYRGDVMQHTRQDMMGLVFIARLGNQDAVIVATRPGDEQHTMTQVATNTPFCLDEYKSTDWPRLFHSLKFKDWKPNGDAVAKAMLGKWHAPGITAAVDYAFAPNHRYATAGGWSSYNRVDSQTVIMTTRGVFGNGSWKLVGDELTLTPDKKKGKKEVYKIRVQAEMEYGVWSEELYLLTPDYELRMNRETN